MPRESRAEKAQRLRDEVRRDVAKATGETPAAPAKREPSSKGEGPEGHRQRSDRNKRAVARTDARITEAKKIENAAKAARDKIAKTGDARDRAKAVRAHRDAVTARRKLENVKAKQQPRKRGKGKGE
jgi:hypothetical protein